MWHFGAITIISSISLYTERIWNWILSTDAILLWIQVIPHNLLQLTTRICNNLSRGKTLKHSYDTFCLQGFSAGLDTVPPSNVVPHLISLNVKTMCSLWTLSAQYSHFEKAEHLLIHLPVILSEVTWVTGTHSPETLFAHRNLENEREIREMPPDWFHPQNIKYPHGHMSISKFIWKPVLLEKKNMYPSHIHK